MFSRLYFSFIALSFVILLPTHAKPDSFSMTYLKQVGNSRQIAVVTTENNQKVERIISLNQFDTYHPEMGPHGDQVAYSRGTIKPGSEVSVQMVIRFLKEDKIELWSEKANQYIHAEFSGSGRYLVFSGPNPKTKKQNIGIIDLNKERQAGPISVTNTNGGQVLKYEPTIEYIDSQYDCYAPAVSSQGNFIIYHRTLDSSTKLSPKELIRYDRETKTKKLITKKEGHAMFPSLSSDDRHVAFVSKRDEQWDIYRLDLWTEEERQVTLDENIEFTPVFAPDNSLYFTRFQQSTLDGTSEIGIYHLSASDVFNTRHFSQPRPFLDQKNIFEYVPSFSGMNEFEIGALPSFPKPERSSFGAISHQGKVYIVGGHQGPEHTYPKKSFLKRVDIYDMTTKTWRQGASMNHAKHGFELAAYGNYLYAFGGFAFSDQHSPAWQSLNIIERYDITKNKWEVLSTKLPRRRSSNVAAQVGDKVFLIGGWNSTPRFEGDKEGRFHPEIDIFDLKSERISTLEVKLPSPLRRAFNATIKGEDIFLLGGISQGSSHFDWIDNVTRFNTKTYSFSEETKLPYATFAPGAGLLKDGLFFIGGMVLRNASTYDLDYVDDVYRYDFKKRKWSHLGQYLKENKGFPQVVNLSQDTLGVLGGHTYRRDPNGRIIDHPVDSFDTIKAKIKR